MKLKSIGIGYIPDISPSAIEYNINKYLNDQLDSKFNTSQFIFGDDLSEQLNVNIELSIRRYLRTSTTNIHPRQ